MDGARTGSLWMMGCTCAAHLRHRTALETEERLLVGVQSRPHNPRAEFFIDVADPLATAPHSGQSNPQN